MFSAISILVQHGKQFNIQVYTFILKSWYWSFTNGVYIRSTHNTMSLYKFMIHFWCLSRNQHYFHPRKGWLRFEFLWQPLDSIGVHANNFRTGATNGHITSGDMRKDRLTRQSDTNDGKQESVPHLRRGRDDSVAGSDHVARHHCLLRVGTTGVLRWLLWRCFQGSLWKQCCIGVSEWASVINCLIVSDDLVHGFFCHLIGFQKVGENSLSLRKGCQWESSKKGVEVGVNKL